MTILIIFIHSFISCDCMRLSISPWRVRVKVRVSVCTDSMQISVHGLHTHTHDTSKIYKNRIVYDDTLNNCSNNPKCCHISLLEKYTKNSLPLILQSLRGVRCAL